jgi:RNA polymerase sigma-32 factor
MKKHHPKNKKKSEDQRGLVKASAIRLAEDAGDWLPDEGGEQATPSEDFGDTADGSSTERDEADSSEGSEDLYASFVRQATRIKRLTEEEEAELGRRVRDHNDEAAARKLVLHNLRLAIKLANQYRRSWTSIMDLVQEASQGMAIAAKRWDPDQGTRYGTYAVYWIRAQLTKFLMTNARLIHTANTRAGRKVYFNLPKIRRRYLLQGVEPTVEIIAKEIGEEPEEVARVMTRLLGHEASLSTPIDEDSASTLQDALSSGDVGPEEAASRQEISQLVEHLIERFAKTLTNPRDLEIWKKNLVAEDPESLVSLAARFGVSKQRMGQIVTRLKRAFRRHVIDELGPDTQLSWLFSRDNEE